jgi:NADH-quinone oxidoreductase subunit C
MEQKAIYDLLVEKLGDACLGFSDDAGDPVADIAPEKIAEASVFLRDDERLQFNQLMCLSGVDWDGFDDSGKGKSVAILGYTEDGRPETSDRVGEGDLGVVYDLYSHSQKHKFTLRVRVPREVASVPTVSQVWSTAGWHEREAWDLLGIRFAGHQDLRRMLLEENWVGHPLRKDYVMPETWENVPMAGKNICGNPFVTDTPEAPESPDTPSGEGQ